ncbi:MAG: Asp-tRNA(Asn)/Glu-tRNA(Gln) amidotransferase subunit GatC [Defluviitaleaceae bacterium]|nr:Asp-tRNA(Asn)/Glu-tRNA(Gln) amidotransferase subunit GatC [Defluviitaleaceae bacterium]MCL2262401.1 Asp-tRNA(Asn)/Glu-tRNA(Gln) amidotransferase subunit GatC [Defluviitaleaceae bacterium]
MLIDKKTVDYVAGLSRIQLDESQTELMQTELGKILDYMKILQNVNTEGVEPLSHVFSMTNVTRPDEVTGHFKREHLLANAPDRTDEAFVVPKAVDV